MIAKDGRRVPTVVMTGAISDVATATIPLLLEAGANVVLAPRNANRSIPGDWKRSGAVVVDPPVAGFSSLLDAALSRFGFVDAWINDADDGWSTPIADRRSAPRSRALTVVHGSHTALSHFERVGRGLLINVAVSRGAWSGETEATFVRVPGDLLEQDEAITHELVDRGFHDIAVYWASGSPSAPPWVARDAAHAGMLDGMPLGGECDETAARIVQEILGRTGGGPSHVAPDRSDVVSFSMADAPRQTFGSLHPTDAPPTGSSGSAT